jgi:antitoxin component YwqK of YwqJK toxin-antitoxin module
MESRYPGGAIKETYTVCKNKKGDFVREGLYQKFYENGRKSGDGYYKNNQKDSTWKAWNENNNDSIVENWRLSILHGPYFKISGPEITSGNYVNGQKEGYWCEECYEYNTYHFGEHGNYHEGKREGKWIEFAVPLVSNLVCDEEVLYRRGQVISQINIKVYER